MTTNPSVPENSDTRMGLLVALLKVGLRDQDQAWVEGIRELAQEQGFNADELEAEAQAQLAEAPQDLSQPEPMSPPTSEEDLGPSPAL